MTERENQAMCVRKAGAGAVKSSYLAGLFADSYSDKWLWGCKMGSENDGKNAKPRGT